MNGNCTFYAEQAAYEQAHIVIKTGSAVDGTGHSNALTHSMPGQCERFAHRDRVSVASYHRHCTLDAANRMLQ